MKTPQADQGTIWGVPYNNTSWYWYDRKRGTRGILVGGLVLMIAMLGFGSMLIVDMFNRWDMDQIPVRITSPPGHNLGTCDVDTAGRFEMLGQYNGRPVARYHRHRWTFNQCHEGILVEVSEAMIDAWKAGRAAQQQLEQDYERLKTSAPMH